MLNTIFQRNPHEAKRLSHKRLAVIGCGSVGSCFADVAVRAGIASFCLIDPDVLAPENLSRHILRGHDLGTSKAAGVAEAIRAVNPEAKVEVVVGKFTDLEEKPDLILAATDSFFCQSKANDYALRQNVPAIFAGCWGEASVGEVYFVLPGQSACLECFAHFRRDKVEIPVSQERYTNPDHDTSRVPGQAGLWANILMTSALAFQVALGILDPENVRARLIDPERNLLLFNISDFDSGLQNLAVTRGRVVKGCAVCDESKLAELGKNLDVSLRS